MTSQIISFVLASIELSFTQQIIIHLAAVAIVFLFCFLFVKNIISKKTAKLKHATLLIAESDKKFRTLFESANDAILLVRDNKVVDCNEVALGIFECERLRLIGQDPFELSPKKQPDNKPSKGRAKHFYDAVRKDSPQTFYWQFTKFDGRPFHSQVSLSKIELDNEILLQLIIRNTTEHMEIEEAFLISENRYRTLVKALPDITCVFSKDGKILDYSIDDERKIVIKDDEIIGMSLRKLGFFGDNLDRLMDTIKLTLEEGTLNCIEYRLDVPSGKFFWEARISPMEEEKVVAVIRDITERKLIEINLKNKNEELKLINEELTQNNIRLNTVLNELERSETRQAMVLHSLPMAFYNAHHKDQFELRWVNEQIEPISGYSPDELIRNKQMWESCIHPDDRERVLDSFSSIAEMGSIGIEYRWKNSNGKYLWFLDQAAIISISENEPSEIVGSWLDITDRKLTELKLKLTNKEFAALNEAYQTQNKWLQEANKELADSHQKLQNVHKILIENEERYKMLSDLTIEGVFVHKKNVSFDLNESLARIFQYDREELIGKDIIELIVAEESKATLKEMAISENVTPFEVVGKTKSGNLLPIEIESRSARYNGEKVRVTSVRNITERKKAEKAQRESEENFRQLAENINDVYVLRSADNKVLYVSPSFEKVFGRKAEVLRNNPQSMYKWYHPDDLRKFEASEKKSECCEKARDIRHRIIRPDGEIRWLWSREHPVCDENNDVIRMVTVSSDITEQVQTEGERTKLAVTVEQLSEIIIISDTNFKIEYVNPAFEALMGYSGEEIIGKMLFLMLRESKLSAKKLIDLLRLHGQWSGQLTKIKVDGTACNLSTSITSLKDDSGKVMNYVFVGHDITQDLHIQERLRQSQKLEAMGTLAGGIAHDFNNLLTPIQGYSQLIKDDLNPESQSYKDIDQIISASRRAKDLVDQVLMFSRKVDAEYKTFEIQPIINEALTLLRSSIPASIDIQKQIDTEPAFIYGDPSQLHQMLVNMGTNAFHAMEKDGGILSITLKRIVTDESFLQDHTKLSDENQYIRISINDEGIGMEKEVVNRIFEPFFTTKPKGKGTGLGLSIVHGVISSMNGDISVYSEVGNGTSFQIYLPLKKELETKKRQELKSSPKGNNQVIVFVDDDEAVLNYSKRVLSKLDYKIYIFPKVKEALDYLKDQSNVADILISDFTMPQMNGMQFAGKAKKIRPDMPIILISGLIRSLTEKECKACGINKFLTKPYTQDEIGREIYNLLLK